MKSIDNIKELWSKIKKKSKSNYNLTENPPARAGSTRTDSNFHDLTNSESSIDGITDLQELYNSDTDDGFNSYGSYGNTADFETRLDESEFDVTDDEIRSLREKYGFSTPSFEAFFREANEKGKRKLS